MSPAITASRLDTIYLARLADQAERYNDVVALLKGLVKSSAARLTIEERNLLSMAYKNITATLRNSWRTIDTLENKEAPRASPRQIALMHKQKEFIQRDLANISKDVVEVLERFLIPAAETGEEKVFYCKMRGDYYRYLAEFARHKPNDNYASSSLDAYKYAYKHALATLEPTHPTRLGLALNFAVYYHDICDSPDRACYLAKHAFDEAITFASNVSLSGQALEDSLIILQLLRDDMISWFSEIEQGDA